MQGWVDLGEHVEDLLAVDHGAAVLVEVGLDPFSVGAVDDAVQIRDVEVQEVRADAHDGAVLLVELLHPGGILARVDLPDTPEVGPSWRRVSSSACVSGQKQHEPHTCQERPGIFLQGGCLVRDQEPQKHGDGR